MGHGLQNLFLSSCFTDPIMRPTWQPPPPGNTTLTEENVGTMERNKGFNVARSNHYNLLVGVIVLCCILIIIFSEIICIAVNQIEVLFSESTSFNNMVTVSTLKLWLLYQCCISIKHLNNNRLNNCIRFLFSRSRGQHCIECSWFGKMVTKY